MIPWTICVMGEPHSLAAKEKIAAENCEALPDIKQHGMPFLVKSE